MRCMAGNAVNAVNAENIALQRLCLIEHTSTATAGRQAVPGK